MCSRILVIAVMLAMAPLGAKAADLVVWWEEAWYPEEERAIAEMIAAFEQQTGKKIELVSNQSAAGEEVQAALEAGQPPDFLWGLGGTTNGAEQWAYEDRLVNLDQALGPLRELFDADLLERATLLNGRDGEPGLYALPMGRITNHIHVWQDLLERAGFTLADVPKEWEAFWAFWCDRVQPAVRKATGREDIYGVALPMSIEASDTADELDQFLWAYTPHWPPPGGWNLVEAPATRTVLVQTLQRYTTIYEKGCTPPEAVRCTNRDNNKAFLEQRVVMGAEPLALNTEHAEGRSARRLFPKHGDDRMAAQLFWRAAGDHRRPLPRRRVPRGRRSRFGQGVRALPSGGWLARALARLLPRPPAAADARAGRQPILARPERPAPDALGDTDPDAASQLQLVGDTPRS